MPIREWDGTLYDRVSGPQQAMAQAVLDRLQLAGEETVIDAGCGSGRVTEELLALLPRGRVIALDCSASMLDAARQRLAGAIAEQRVQPAMVDLLELDLDGVADAVFSTATFHWIGDHERLFGNLHRALRPGGRLVAQCGGEGNIDALRGRVRTLLARDPYAAHFRDWQPPWHYASPERTRERLLAAGFSAADCWRSESPQQPEHPREFLSEVILAPHLEQLPASLRERFLDDALAVLGEPVVVDYVRLNIDARA
jgi:trans-aconitate 2-methyltransferase